MHSRIDRINELIGQKVSEVLHKYVLEPDQYFTVTNVATSGDLGYSDISISFIEDAEKSIKVINSNLASISRMISGELNLRKMPKLRFHLDTGLDEAQKIEKLFKKI